MRESVWRGDRGDIIITHVILISLVSVLCFISTAPMSAAQLSRQLEKDDWIVSSLEMITDQTVVLSGNLSIETGGKLVLQDSELVVNLSSDDELQIQVYSNGIIQLRNSTIRSANTSLQYRFLVDGELISDNSTIRDMDVLQFSHSKGQLNHTTIQGRGLVYAGYSQIGMVGCIIAVTNDTGVSLHHTTADIRSTMIRGNDTAGSPGLLINGSSDVWIEGGGIYNFTTGLSSKSSSVHLKDVLIRDSIDVGIQQVGGDSDISGSRIVDNGQGISCQYGTTIIRNNDVKASKEGIELNACQAEIELNTIREGQWGIWSNGSETNITNNTIRNNVMGVLWVDSDIGEIFGNILQDNDKGMEVHGSRIVLETCIFTKNVVDIELIESDVSIIDTPTYVHVIDPSSTLTVLWYLDISVVDNVEVPMPGVQIEIVDQLGNVLNLTSGPDGWTRDILLKEVINRRYFPTFFSPYNVTARNLTAEDRRTVHLQGSGLITLTLKEVDLFFNEIRMTDPEIEVGEMTTIVAVINATTFPIQDVSVLVEVDGIVLSRDNITMTTNGLQYPIPFRPTTAGEKNVTIRLDVDDLILETNETNNMASITISVKENTSNLLPDLRIHGISQSSANPLVGSDVQFTIEVQNQGTAVADSVLVRLFIDDELVGSKTIASIPAGAVASTEFEWGARTGEHVITVEIDSFNTILESDETNNIYTNDISVGDNPQGLPLDPGTLWMCLGGIITFIMIILVLLVIMARKGSRTTGMTGPQYQVPKDRVGIRDYGTTSPLEPVPASIRPSSTRSPSRTYQGGQAVCKRCGSTDIKYFNDGHMQCKHCRKIFF